MTGYDQDETGVVAKLANGETVRGGALIGADGLWSNVRRQVVGDGNPRVSGHTTYRSVIPTEQMPEDLRWNAATLWAGPKCHIVHYPLSGWKVFNLVVTYHNDAPEPVAGKPVPVEEVRKWLRPYLPARAEHHRPRQGLAHVGAVRSRAGRQMDRRPGGAAGRRRPSHAAIHGAGRLHGDGGRGVPGRFPCRTDTLEAGLASYRDRRVLRTTRLQLMSRAMGDHIYHPAGPHAALRNAIMTPKARPVARHPGVALWRQRTRMRHNAADMPAPSTRPNEVAIELNAVLVALIDERRRC